MQGHQIVVNKSLTSGVVGTRNNLELPLNSSLNKTIRVLNEKLGTPFRLEVTGASTVRIGDAEMQTTDGSNLTGFKAPSPVGNKVITHSAQTLTINYNTPSTFSGTGTPFTLPVVSNNAYLKIGLQTDKFGNITAVTGVEGASEVLATSPTFSDGKYPIGYIVLQKDGALSSWKTLFATMVHQFSGGGGGGGGGGSDVSAISMDTLLDHNSNAAFTEEFKDKTDLNYNSASFPFNTTALQTEEDSGRADIFCGRTVLSSISAGGDKVSFVNPGFTLTAGDLLIQATTVKRIEGFTAGGTKLIVSILTGDLTAGEAQISNAVCTNDLNSINDLNSWLTASIGNVVCDFQGSDVGIFSLGKTRKLACQVSSDGINWTPYFKRPFDPYAHVPETLISNTGKKLYARFFGVLSDGLMLQSGIETASGWTTSSVTGLHTTETAGEIKFGSNALKFSKASGVNYSELSRNLDSGFILAGYLKDDGSLQEGNIRLAVKPLPADYTTRLSAGELRFQDTGGTKYYSKSVPVVSWVSDGAWKYIDFSTFVTAGGVNNIDPTKLRLRFYTKQTTDTLTDLIFDGLQWKPTPNTNIDVYRMFWHPDPEDTTGGIFQQSWCLHNNTQKGGDSVLTVSAFGGGTKIDGIFNYPVNINPGKALGVLRVKVDNKLLSRKVGSFGDYEELDGHSILITPALPASPPALPIVISREQGTIDMTVNPSVGAKYKQPAAQGFITGIGSPQIVDYSALEYDTYGNVTTGVTWKFTAMFAGYYTISARAVFDSAVVSAAGHVYRMAVQKNLAMVDVLDAYTAEAAVAEEIALQGSTEFYLAVGDYVSITLAHSAGVPRNLKVSAVDNYCIIRKVG